MAVLKHREPTNITIYMYAECIIDRGNRLDE
jgi:hypothetical protein